MKYVSIGLVGVAATGFGADVALAADMPLKAAPAPAPLAARWNGFYVGGHVGGAWAGADPWTANLVDPINAVSNSFPNPGDSNFLFGGQIGYNWQFNSSWVVGVEADYSRTQLSEIVSTSNFFVGNVLGTNYATAMRRDLNWLASVRGRIGYATDMLLLYVTGGVAWGGLHYAASSNIFSTPSYAADFGETATGYVLGGGLEYALNRNWSIRGEYLFYSLEGANASSLNTVISNNPMVYHWDDSKTHVARFGINYRVGP